VFTARYGLGLYYNSGQSYFLQAIPLLGQHSTWPLAVNVPSSTYLTKRRTLIL
jgi:hypothetical protein